MNYNELLSHVASVPNLGAQNCTAHIQVQSYEAWPKQFIIERFDLPYIVPNY
jgi:hypothetical protein